VHCFPQTPRTLHCTQVLIRSFPAFTPSLCPVHPPRTPSSAPSSPMDSRPLPAHPPAEPHSLHLRTPPRASPLGSAVPQLISPPRTPCTHQAQQPLGPRGARAPPGGGGQGRWSSRTSSQRAVKGPLCGLTDAHAGSGRVEGPECICGPGCSKRCWGGLRTSSHLLSPLSILGLSNPPPNGGQGGGGHTP
jgi:hypothetical protein